jgi:lambda family phage holin
MPDKDPNNWAALFAALDAVPPSIKGAIMAFVIAVLRIIYDRQETSNVRIVLEAGICGCLSLSFSGALGWLGAPESVAVAIGGAVGFIGVTKIRELAINWLTKKAGK